MAFYLGSNKIASGGSGTASSSSSETSITDLKLNYLTEEQYQEALTNNQINENELYFTPDDQGGGGGEVSGDALPIGAIMPYPKATAPENWLACDGSAVSRTDYSELFNAIGTTFGKGDGSTTFNLPNLKGRVPVGLDTTDTDFNTVGKTVGEKTHTLSELELPAHKHPNQHYAVSVNARNYRAYEATLATGTGNVYLATADSNDAGGGQAHNNIQPSIVTNYIIKAKQSASLVATVVDNLESTSATDALSAKQGQVLNKKTETRIITGQEYAANEWIDGKQVYAKRLSTTWGSDDYTDIQVGLSNIAHTPIRFEAFVIGTTNNVFNANTPRAYGTDVQVYQLWSFWQDSTDDFFFYSNGMSREGSTVVVTVYYTKN